MKSLSTDSENRQVDFDAPSDRGMKAEFIRTSIWETAKNRPLDLTETNKQSQGG